MVEIEEDRYLKILSEYSPSKDLSGKDLLDKYEISYKENDSPFLELSYDDCMPYSAYCKIPDRLITLRDMRNELELLNISNDINIIKATEYLDIFIEQSFRKLGFTIGYELDPVEKFRKQPLT